MSDNELSYGDENTIKKLGQIWSLYLNHNLPSDEIHMEKKVSYELRKLMIEIFGDSEWPVDDLLLSNLPLYDFEVHAVNDYHKPFAIRFCIVKNLLEGTIKRFMEEDTTGLISTIGAVVFKQVPAEAFLLIAVGDGICGIGFTDELYDMRGNYLGRFSERYGHGWKKYLEAVKEEWAKIELALLNPQTIEVFSNPKIVKRKAKKDRRSGEKRITRYVRRHVIDGDKIRSARKASINRHCKAWLVIGHWRHYKNGKKVFIKPYWKGELRELQTNLDKGRIRQISTEKQH